MLLGQRARIGTVLVAASCWACAQSALFPLAADTVMITSSAAPICGPTGAQKVAVSQAAIATLQAGYDRFQIIDGRYANNV